MRALLGERRQVFRRIELLQLEATDLGYICENAISIARTNVVLGHTILEKLDRRIAANFIFGCKVLFNGGVHLRQRHRHWQLLGLGRSLRPRRGELLAMSTPRSVEFYQGERRLFDK